MEIFYSQVLPPLIVVGIIILLTAVYVGQRKTAPAWLQRTAFRIRLLGKWLSYIVGGLFVLASLALVLPLIIQEGAMWLFPQSTFGYAMRYELPDNKVVIERQPHDCEWDSAPIGSKHCHYEKIVQTETDQNGKVTAVYVNWQKVQD